MTRVNPGGSGSVCLRESRRPLVVDPMAGGLGMAGGTDISFTSDGLRHGGRLSSATADAAGAVAGQIASIPIDGAAFGQLAAAAALGTTLAAFRDGHAELGRQVQAAHVELAGRAADAAQGGDQMVRNTAARAGSVPTLPGFAR